MHPSIGCPLPAAKMVLELQAERDELQEVLEDKRRLAREIDVIINGDGAAAQASLCDLVGQIRELAKWKAKHEALEKRIEGAMVVNIPYYYISEHEAINLHRLIRGKLFAKIGHGQSAIVALVVLDEAQE